MQAQTVFNLVLLGIGWVFSLASVGMYITYNRGWYRSPIGQLLMSTSFSVGLFYLYFFVVFLWPELPGRSLIRSLLFLTTTVFIVWRFFLLVKLLRVINSELDMVKERSTDS